MIKKTKPRRERRQLADLSDYPLQQAFAGTTTEHDDEDLRESIHERGLQHPIEILPANDAGLDADTILDGHRRRDALLANGEEEIGVIVRYDLASASREEIDQAFLHANTDRRQLDPVSRAYLAAQRIAIEYGWSLDELLMSYAAQEVRERVGKMLGISGRHLSRLLRVIRTPMEVQAAVRQKRLSIVLAEKVADLPEDDQDVIVDRIQSGEPAKLVVESFVGGSSKEPANVGTAFVRYLRALSAAQDAITISDIKFSPKPDDLDLLASAIKFNEGLITRLVRNEKRNTKERNRALARINALAKRGHEDYC
ncbi:MAG: ParB N-terminal domain-containing protein [Pirellulaceae bacterium]